ncbi:ABC transporter substrate-binding protein [Paeniroseomonas aquatica]|uniref:ABC transporter substrate-binding protein n=1 Tax=Paeniroseomonas aquatica TaxID=373043 RepID=A0ABT8ABL3_9PROT|nr:ABC transporter substrate-binding protein [Paeniroseomonas aquatica]MDN3567156.1 ABC transporter substrate-binding protein [Paeniroseomonas aquatica]
MSSRRSLLGSAIGLASASGLATPGLALAQTPGVTATEIRIGNTMSYSGPVSSLGVQGKSIDAYVRMVNDAGGVGGRRIKFLSYDDAYSPPKTVEQVRRLVEQDQVACLVSNLGTPTNSAILRYTNQRKVPNLFPSTGADKWSNYREYPWTIGFPPSYRIEAQIYARYMLEVNRAARIAILYQNDDFGRDYVNGVRDVLGERFDQVVKLATYESTDPTIDSQLIGLQATGADALVLAVTAKFGSQAIRKLHDIQWRPTTCIHYGANSVGVVLQPAGLEKAIGLTTAAYMKDPTDPEWAEDPGMKEWRGFMVRYMPEGDLTDANYVYGYSVARLMHHVLQHCGQDFSRENIMRQAASLQDVELPTMLPGIRLNSSPTNYRPIRQMQLQRWTGRLYERFGPLVEGAIV